MSYAHATPARRRQSHGPSNDDALAQSLRQLSLSTGGTPSKSPSPLSRTTATTTASSSAASRRSPSVASTRRSSTAFAPSTNGGRESRAGTPALLRKASMNSLHSGGSGTNSNTNSSPSGNSRGLTRRASAANLKSPSRSPLVGGGGGYSGFEALREEQQQQRRPARPPPPTAAEIARKHFQGELARHAALASASPTPSTVVVLHDACYGHRFARPRTSRANLGTIVERPERVQACAVGVSAAYVRLGGRHADGDYMPHPHRDPAAIPVAAVPFRIHKTARTLPLLSPAVTNVHGTKWMEELTMMCEAAESKLALNGRELQRPDNIDRSGGGGGGAAPARALHEGDLYLCAESLQALEGALGGVCEAVDAVFGSTHSSTRRAFVAVRPPGHHCSADWPSGFCWINNVHVGVMHAALAHGLTHAAIVDIDLHHGDGSQAIAWQHNARGAAAAKNAAAWKKTSIGYFSLHDINSFPCEAGDPEKVKNASLCLEGAHGQTVWNVHLEPWKTEAAFWALYARKYAALLDKLRAFLRAQADQRGRDAAKGAVFVSAGFDASEWETSSMQRHKVNVPTEFYARFTRDVVQIADEECAGRVVSVLEGGYSDRALVSGVLSHVSGLAGADPALVASRDEEMAFHAGLGYEMGSRMGALGIVDADNNDDEKPNTTGTPYDPAWWASAELDRIEAAVAPPPPAPEPPTNHPPHPSTTYSSPTASSQAKVNTTPKFLRRSMSSLSNAYNGSAPPSRPPSPPPPPPPEVPWTVAMHELSKLLIPTDRPTTSCTVEDLSAEATRARRDRQALLLGRIDTAGGGGGGGVAQSAAAAAPATPATPGGPTRVSMRERKQVKPFGASSSAEEDPELDRKNRRKTVAGVSTTTTTTTAARGRPKQTARRLSAASTIVVPKDDLDLPPLPPPPQLSTNGGSSTRPPSAHSSSTATTRPGSSLSAATTAGGQTGGTTSVPSAPSSSAPLSVRKARPAAGAATGKTPRAKKTAPAVTKPAATAKTSFSRSSSGSTAAGSATGSATGSAAATDDLDAVASGMRKIKINVVTAAQKEARAKAQQQQKEAAAKTAAKPLSAASTAATTPRTATPLATPAKPVHPSTPLAQTLGAPTLRLTEAADAVAVAAAADSDGHSPLLTPTTDEALSVHAAHDAPAPTVFIPYQPEEVATPVHHQQQQQQPLSSAAQLHWLPPNEVNTPVSMSAVAATPSPMKRADLPVFTATSTIPFAGGPSSSSRPSSSGLSAGGSSRPTSSGAMPALGTTPPVLGTTPVVGTPASPTARPRSPTKSPSKAARKMQV